MSSTTKIKSISAESYKSFLEVDSHIFLVGNLKKAQPSPFFQEARLEIIICHYLPGDNGLPHWHQEITEYELVLTGKIGYLESELNNISWFSPGDLICISPGLCVKRIINEKASSLTIKVPSNSEKKHCNDCKRDCAQRIS